MSPRYKGGVVPPEAVVAAADAYVSEQDTADPAVTAALHAAFVAGAAHVQDAVADPPPA